eukprot:TRINITY_DN4413_c0_g2_i1.p1 TRINITY_DN4413_c0_g2~~TRINITY_DN4413_c0_g2_i1.p1  ORF type:complete len:547 (-),score=82.34 TRINITY_DN4413_c0_g2_i1:323-1963(-)
MARVTTCSLLPFLVSLLTWYCPEAVTTCVDAEHVVKPHSHGLTLLQVTEGSSGAVVQKKIAASASVWKKSAASASGTQAADVALAMQIRSYFLDLGNLGESLTGGLSAIMQAVPYFTLDTLDRPLTSSQVSRGFAASGEGLLNEILKVLSSSGQVPQVEQFKGQLPKIFEDLPSKVPGLMDMVNSFHDTGNAGSLIQAFGSVLDYLDFQVRDVLPSSSGDEISKYLGSLRDVFDSLAEGSDEFDLGSLDDALKAISNGLRAATYGLAPGLGSETNDLSNIMDKLDPILGSFFETISGFKKQMEGSKVCWKSTDTVLRQKVRPSKCPENYELDGERWCVPAGLSSDAPVNLAESLLQNSLGRQAQTSCRSTEDCQYPGCDQPDHVICYAGACYTGTVDARCSGVANLHHLGDGGWCYEGRRDISCPAPARSHLKPPQCDADGEFPDQIGAWCYKACPAGSVPSKAGHLCKSVCGGKYPSSEPTAPLLCGKTEEALQQAVQKMVARSMQSVVGIFSGGFSSASLPGTFSSFVKAAQGFTHPKCPIDEQ